MPTPNVSIYREAIHGMSPRKRSTKASAAIRFQGSLEIAGLWFEGVRVTVDRTNGVADVAAAGHLDLDETSAGVLARLAGEPALLTVGNTLQMEVALTPDLTRPGRFTFHAASAPPAAEE